MLITIERQKAKERRKKYKKYYANYSKYYYLKKLLEDPNYNKKRWAKAKLKKPLLTN